MPPSADCKLKKWMLGGVVFALRELGAYFLFFCFRPHETVPQSLLAPVIFLLASLRALPGLPVISRDDLALTLNIPACMSSLGYGCYNFYVKPPAAEKRKRESVTGSQEPQGRAISVARGPMDLKTASPFPSRHRGQKKEK
jgi:hypothetical protein